MSKVPMTASKPFRYMGKALTAGDPFEARPNDAKVLAAVKRAQYITPEAGSDAPEARGTGRARMRRPGAPAPAPAQTPDDTGRAAAASAPAAPDVVLPPASVDATPPAQAVAESAAAPAAPVNMETQPVNVQTPEAPAQKARKSGKTT